MYQTEVSHLNHDRTQHEGTKATKTTGRNPRLYATNLWEAGAVVSPLKRNNFGPKLCFEHLFVGGINAVDDEMGQNQGNKSNQSSD